ncbi:MAG: YbjN domain-containing protein [Candidatus Hydrogenedentes bacterium]|jgi:hypothetical protein|nr:YbjN domain-containing protein [Candidatus Hydrogenedentota bacterium]
MAALTDIVKEFFEANDWEYEQDPDNEGAFLAGVDTDNGEFDLIVLVENGANHLMCICVCPDEVPEDRRAEVAEYLLRVNANTVIGSYGMDYDDGTLRVRSTINLADMIPTVNMVGVLLEGTVTTADVYYPGLLAVIDGEASAEDALDQVFQELDDEDTFEEN